MEQLDAQIQAIPQKQQDVERRKRVEAWMDAGYGCSILCEPAIADMVQGAFLFFDAQRYRLLAWVIMPNHVHTLFQPMPGWTVAKIVSSWKKFTATRISANPGNANLPIGGKGRPVWHREYWDRYIRNDTHFQQAMAYIHANPVKAGLVTRAEAWLWSSASLQAATQESGVPGGMP